jgi:hypothetical protein
LVTVRSKQAGEMAKITYSRSGSSRTVKVRVVDAATVSFPP